MATTDSDHDSPIFPNLANDVVPTGPNQLWVADTTYIAIAVGFVYTSIDGGLSFTAFSDDTRFGDLATANVSRCCSLT